ASDPTSTIFDFQYNKSGFFVSFATLLLLTQILVCCIDRLKSQNSFGHSLFISSSGKRRHNRTKTIRSVEVDMASQSSGELKTISQAGD
ncbi:MAG: hypothetical protein WB444_15425, partial [Gallionella sp.]